MVKYVLNIINNFIKEVYFKEKIIKIKLFVNMYILFINKCFY